MQAAAAHQVVAAPVVLLAEQTPTVDLKRRIGTESETTDDEWRYPAFIFHLKAVLT